MTNPFLDGEEIYQGGVLAHQLMTDFPFDPEELEDFKDPRPSDANRSRGDESLFDEFVDDLKVTNNKDFDKSTDGIVPIDIDLEISNDNDGEQFSQKNILGLATKGAFLYAGFCLLKNLT